MVRKAREHNTTTASSCTSAAHSQVLLRWVVRPVPLLICSANSSHMNHGAAKMPRPQQTASNDASSATATLSVAAGLI